MARLTADAVALRREVEALRAEGAARAAFWEEANARTGPLDTLARLTDALPDGVWLTDLSYAPPELRFSGTTADGAAELVLALSEEDGFRDPALVGQVSRADEGRERFSILARVR